MTYWLDKRRPIVLVRVISNEGNGFCVLEKFIATTRLVLNLLIALFSCQHREKKKVGCGIRHVPDKILM